MSNSRNYRELAKLGLGVAAALWGVGNMSFFLMPHLIQGLVSGEIGLSESRAGLVGTIELLCLAGTILVLSPRMGTIAKRQLAIGGIVVAAAGFLASALFDQLILIIACRVVAGIGAGCSMAAANALVASCEEPEQVYAWSFIVGAPIQAGIIATMPYFIEIGGHSGGYAFQAACTVCFLAIVLLLFPRDVSTAETEAAERWVPKFFEVVIIFAIFLFLVADGGTWSFTERVGVSLGIDIRTIGILLGVAVIMVPVGSALASVVGMRFGRYLPLTVGLGLMAVSVYVLTHTTVHSVYMGAQVSYNFIYAFALPFVYGTAAAMDPKGRVIVAAMGIGLVGGAIAPFLSGLLAEATGAYGVLGVVYGCIFLCVLVLSLLVARTIDSPDT